MKGSNVVYGYANKDSNKGKLDRDVQIDLYFMDDAGEDTRKKLRKGTLNITPIFSTQSSWLNQ